MNFQQITNLYKQAKYLQSIDEVENPKYALIFNQLRGVLEGYDQRKLEIVTPEEQDNPVDQSQSVQFQAQILAYKYLIRNISIPKGHEKILLRLSTEQWGVECMRLFMNSMEMNKEKAEKNELLRWLISEKMHKSSENNSTVGQSTPSESYANENTLRFFIEKPNFFIEKRKAEILNYLHSGVVKDEALTKLNCELKFLELREFYNKIKHKIIDRKGAAAAEKTDNNKPDKNTDSKTPALPSQSSSNKSIPLFETTFLDRSMYRREKPQKKVEGKMVEKFELQIKNDQDHRKRQRHMEFVNAVFKHQQDFYEFHRKKYRISKKRIQHVKSHLEWLEKKEQDQKDKQEKERVKALKAQDFEAYIELVQKTKNTRILELLNQTDSFLRQIGAKVKIQRGENPDNIQDDEMKRETGSEEETVSYLKNSNKIYYNLSHSTREEIKEQPKLLEGGNLKNYQLIGLQWLVSLYNNRLNGVLADEMGLGKTIQTIALFCYLMENKQNYGPFLIVVPLTTLSNWVYEFDKWAPSIKKVVYKGTPPHRKMLAMNLKGSKWNVCITTYEYILKDRLILNKFEWKYIIVDEGHRMKNSRSKFAQTLGQQYNSDNRLLLTGTPLQNNLAELWSLLNFLLPKVFSSCDDFEKWFSMPLARIASDKEKCELSEEERLLIINRLHQVLRPFLLRRVKKEVESEIPNKVEHVLKIELSSWQKIVYNQIKDNGILSRDPSTGKIASKALMNLMMQLRKICNHPYLFLDSSEYTSHVDDNIYRVSGKFELLDRILPKLISCKHRILIFSQMTQLMDIMQLYFQFRNYKYLRLDGNTKADERGERMAMFNKEHSEYDIFLLSTRAGGLGLNLQSADTVVLFDSDWNPQMDLQAQDRAHRIGQKSEVRVFRLVTNSWIEEEILAKAAFKMNLDEIFIQAGLYNQKSTDTERRERLEDLLKKKNVYEELDDEIPNDEQINEMLARNEDELNLFDAMDKERYEREKRTFKKFKEPQKGDGKYYNYRLITEEEVPEWIKSSPKNEENMQEYGRGNRVRKQVNYVDDMTDNQWLKMMEEAKEFSDLSSYQDMPVEKLKNVVMSNKKKTVSSNNLNNSGSNDLEDKGPFNGKRERNQTKDKSLKIRLSNLDGNSGFVQDDLGSFDDEPFSDDKSYRRIKKVKKTGNNNNNNQRFESLIDKPQKIDEEIFVEEYN